MAGRSMPIQMSLGLRPASTADQQAARFHRESDRRRLRAMLAGIGGACIVVALVLGLVGLRMQQVRLSYRLEVLRAARAGVEEANRRLLVEKASLLSLARVEVEARTRLGMVAPTQQQVQLAREFVGSGTATATLGGRTASATAQASEATRAALREPARDAARALVR